MSYVTKTIPLSLNRSRYGGLDYVRGLTGWGESVLCVSQLRKFVELPEPAPKQLWLTITTEPLDDAVAIQQSCWLRQYDSLKICYPSGRFYDLPTWYEFVRAVGGVLMLSDDPKIDTVYAYVEYEV